MTVTDSGVFSGTPPSTASFTYTLRATTEFGFSEVTKTATPLMPLALSPTLSVFVSVGGGMPTSPYVRTFTVSGNPSAPVYSVVDAGGVPAPEWITFSDLVLTVFPDGSVTEGVYGPYRLKLVDGETTVYSNAFNVTVRLRKG